MADEIPPWIYESYSDDPQQNRNDFSIPEGSTAAYAQEFGQPTDVPEIVAVAPETNESTKTTAKTTDNSSSTSSPKVDLEANYESIVKLLSDQIQTYGNIVNVVTSFPWSVNYANKNLEKRIPAVYIEEFKQGKSTLATSAYWALNTASQAVNSKGFIDNLNDIIKTVSSKDPIVNKAETGTYNNLLNLNPSLLSPYANMYALASTGVKYVFPYYSTNDADWSFSNSYGDNPSSENFAQNTFNEVMKFGTTAMANIQSFQQILDTFSSEGSPLNTVTNGVFVERPKYFQMPTTNEIINVSFTLYNTIPAMDGNKTIMPWQKNLALIKSLVIKNLPFKTDVFKYISPVLYRVQIPGMKYFPLSYISSLSATPKGIKTVVQEDPNIIVPEAWDVNIKFTSIFLPSANLAYSGFDNANKITIS